ncbi:histidine--tRNA ligase [Leucobacter sp. OH1287]|uniref:histidine--tRNA ligase n=1 Tax=Leucobacter sp. OH1287 TaxID=2491049 RepID=UPI000F5E3477|nr:histidine--tRNA ligase [Leucobacter sp. OH1287]RRD60522.1 histidine--tRNA ligase [Leucobacter sp. OH1287]
MVQKVNATRGMRDFLPAEKARRERALNIIREVYRSHGFTEIEAPAVEDFGRLHSGLGGDNEKLSFSILKRGLTGQDLSDAAAAESTDSLTDLGLRFDLTVPLARYYATNRAQLPGVFRAIHIGPVWRAERPQRGRYRQFVQSDIDIIGEGSALAEAELITATSQALDALGLQDCAIRVNDRRILTELLNHCGFSEEEHAAALITVDKLDKIGAEGVVAELAEQNPEAADEIGRVLARFEQAGATVAGGAPLNAEAIAAVLPEGVASEAAAHLDELAQAVTPGLPAGVTLCFDPTLVRGMGYYTGTIFEIAHPGSGSSVGGGGRYDGMIGRFLGEDVPAVGFSIGFERIMELVELPSSSDAEVVALISDKDLPAFQLLALKRELLDAGKTVRIVWRQKNMKALLSNLAAEGVTHTAAVRAETAGAADLEIRPLAG